MPTQEYYGTPEGYVRFWCIMDCDELEGPGRELMIMSLKMAAANVNVALQSAGATQCTFSDTSLQMLAQLTYVGAALFYNCPCNNARLTEEQILMYSEWLKNNLEAIRDGELELCQGETGSGYPSMGFAQQNVTPWTENQIRQNAETNSG